MHNMERNTWRSAESGTQLSQHGSDASTEVEWVRIIGIIDVYHAFLFNSVHVNQRTGRMRTGDMR